MKSVVCNRPYVKLALKMYKFLINNKKVFCYRSCLQYDCRLKSTFANNDVKCTSNENLKSFDQIPGPKSYPVIGTLYKYLPLVGEYNNNYYEYLPNVSFYLT